MSTRDDEEADRFFHPLTDADRETIHEHTLEELQADYERAYGPMTPEEAQEFRDAFQNAIEDEAAEREGENT